MAGIFADISRVWITVDHRIYLWNYSDTSDLTYYDGLQEVSHYLFTCLFTCLFTLSGDPVRLSLPTPLWCPQDSHQIPPVSHYTQ